MLFLQDLGQYPPGEACKFQLVRYNQIPCLLDSDYHPKRIEGW